jgi:Galactose oxidase, central domain
LWGTATLLRDGKVLVAGGGESGGPSAELYDPASGTWTATGKMVYGGGGATLLLDGKVLVAGAGDGTSAELYDPARGTWTATGSMLTPGGTATLLRDGRVLVVSGDGGPGSSSCCAPNIHGDLPSAELYDPASGTWTATSDTIRPRSGHTATLLPDGKVLVAGGVGVRGIGPDASAELYDPASGTWTRTSNMIEVHGGGTATLLSDGTVLLVGGFNGAYFIDPVRTDAAAIAGVELYDPGSGN